MQVFRHMRRSPYESLAAPVSNNAADLANLTTLPHRIKTAVPKWFRHRSFAGLNSSVRFGTRVERRLNRALRWHCLRKSTFTTLKMYNFPLVLDAVYVVAFRMAPFLCLPRGRKREEGCIRAMCISHFFFFSLASLYDFKLSIKLSLCFFLSLFPAILSKLIIRVS